MSRLDALAAFEVYQSPQRRAFTLRLLLYHILRVLSTVFLHNLRRDNNYEGNVHILRIKTAQQGVNNGRS